MRSLTLAEKRALLEKMKLLLKQKTEQLEILKAKKERESSTIVTTTNDNLLLAAEDKCPKTSSTKSLKRRLQFDDENISSTSSQKNSEVTAAIDSRDGAESINTSCSNSNQLISSEASRCEGIQGPSFLLTETDVKHSTAVGCCPEGLEKLKSQTKPDVVDFYPEEVDPEFSSLKRRKIQEGNEENASPQKLSEVEHPPELSCQTPSQILDFHWFKSVVPLTIHDQEDGGCLLCTCEKGILVYRKNGGNWVKIVDWTVTEERIKNASILKVHKDKLTLHVSIVLSSTWISEMPLHSKESNIHDTSLIKFSDGRLTCRNSVHRYQIGRFTAPDDSVLQCTILPDNICIASTSSSSSPPPPSSSSPPSSSPPSLPSNKNNFNGEHGIDELVTSVKNLKVCVDSLSTTSSVELQRVSDRIVHLLHVSKSSVVCGLSRDGAYLWQYEVGLLLKKFTFGVECFDFNPCCDLIHQDKGLLVLAGRTPKDRQGRLIFLNPMSGVNVSVALRELISACDVDELRLLRCGGPLQKAVFVSESCSKVLDVFSTRGNEVTISKALVPQVCTSRPGSRSDMVVKFDSKMRQMSFGRDKGFCVCKIELD